MGDIHTVTRWAVYLRDGLACAYCGVTMLEILKDYDTNFLTIDHVDCRPRVRGKNGAARKDHDPSNLTACCYHCNTVKGRKSLRAFCGDADWSYDAVKSRLRRNRARDIASYREAARVLLGRVPGVPLADMVLDHDWLVKRQWSEADLEGDYWVHVRESLQHTLFCPACRRPEGDTAGAVRDRWQRYALTPAGSGHLTGPIDWDDNPPF